MSGLADCGVCLALAGDAITTTRRRPHRTAVRGLDGIDGGRDLQSARETMLVISGEVEHTGTSRWHGSQSATSFSKPAAATRSCAPTTAGTTTAARLRRLPRQPVIQTLASGERDLFRRTFFRSDVLRVRILEVR
jgi:hypothetical protein